MKTMIMWLEDMVDSVGGIVNFILCFVLASFMAALVLFLFALVAALYMKAG